MDTRDSAKAVERQLDRELGLVADAIAMVVSGGSRRVVVGGLLLGDLVLEPARRLAAGSGVRIVPHWTADESGVDIAVERPE